jgi:hypothetical protein
MLKPLCATTLWSPLHDLNSTLPPTYVPVARATATGSLCTCREEEEEEEEEEDDDNYISLAR